MFCTRCGHPNRDDARFCAKCGAPLQGDPTLSLTPVETEDEAHDEFPFPHDELEPGQALLLVKRGPNAGSTFLLDGRRDPGGSQPGQRRLPRRHHGVAHARGVRTARRRRRGSSSDVGSLNGTYVNGEQVDETKLASRRRGADRASSSLIVLRGRGVMEQMAGTRNYQSIGEVLVSVKTEFPDITISQDPVPRGRGADRTRAHAVGLPQVLRRRRRPAEVDPADAARRVPAAEGDQGAPAHQDAERAVRRGRRRDRDADATARPTATATEELAEAPTGLQMSIEEMSAATGVERDRIKELESFGIVCSHGPDGAKYYDGDDYIVLSIVKDFFRFGIEPRHLTMYKHFAEREADVLRGASWRPRCARRTPTLGGRPPQTLADLSVTSRKFKQALLRTNLRDDLQSA